MRMAMNKKQILEQCNAICKNTLMETLEIDYVDVSENALVARMPVSSRVHQPDGVLHGGATVALAESVGSAAAFVFFQGQEIAIRGIEISANHLRSVKDGFVYAHAKCIHKGRTIQLWHIEIKDEASNLVSFVKLTTLILNR